MSVTYGFYNSLNGDRKYNALQMSSIFDGIIEDGVFQSIGTAFAVTASSGNVVNVGIGRAWFNHTWTYNDAILPITLDETEVLLDRIDAVVIEVNSTESVRENSIKVVKGTPSSSPQRPTMESTTYIHQYPLAYIYRKAGATSIGTADITNVIGQSATPFVTGPLSVMSIDDLVAQWQAQWNRWYTAQTSADETMITDWLSEKQLEYNTWFSNLQTILSGDAAANLAAQILALQEKFTVLSKEYCIYNTIDDENGDPIVDSYDSEMEGNIVYVIK